MIGMMALALATAPGYSRLAASVRTFHHHFQDLSTMGPVERLVFSFFMTRNG